MNVKPALADDDRRRLPVLAATKRLSPVSLRATLRRCSGYGPDHKTKALARRFGELLTRPFHRSTPARTPRGPQRTDADLERPPWSASSGLLPAPAERGGSRRACRRGGSVLASALRRCPVTCWRARPFGRCAVAFGEPGPPTEPRAGTRRADARRDPLHHPGLRCARRTGGTAAGPGGPDPPGAGRCPDPASLRRGGSGRYAPWSHRWYWRDELERSSAPGHDAPGAPPAPARQVATTGPPNAGSTTNLVASAAAHGPTSRLLPVNPDAVERGVPVETRPSCPPGWDPRPSRRPVSARPQHAAGAVRGARQLISFRLAASRSYPGWQSSMDTSTDRSQPMPTTSRSNHT